MVAVNDVSFAIPPQGITALCGPNGAGKTTLLNVIAGSTGCDSGEVIFAGDALGSSRPEERFRRGISRTFQAIHLVKSRSVVDNVAVACLSTKQNGLVRGFGRNRIRLAREEALQALDELDLVPFAWELVGTLTLETQRLVELARALASHPRLLVLDEPASGLSSSERVRLQEVLVEVGKNVAVLLVEHDLQLVRSIAERVLVLEHGSLIFDGASTSFTSLAELTGISTR